MHVPHMPRKKDPNRILRGKLNLTIHPEIRTYADELAIKRRRSVSQLFEDLIEAEWLRMQAPPPAPTPAPAPSAPVAQQMVPPPFYMHPYGAPMGAYAPVQPSQQQGQQ